MRINKLTASFGKLENETLELHEGLNVIYAPNESGKSTWCAFIRAMLFGVDSSERSRTGYLPDKLRYAPWSGAPMDGSMELTADRCNITLTRGTKAKSAPMREFSATYTGSNVPVEGMNGTNAGELLTGVSKDVFGRSAFIAQGTVAVTGSPELEKRISAIVSTGEEQTSYTEADERLRAWQRKRRYNRRGLLPELESQMDDAQRKLEDMSGSADDIQSLEERLERARGQCAALEQAVTESRKKQRREALERLNAGRAELKARSDEHDAAIAEVSLRREELRGGDFGGRNRQQLEAEVSADRDTLKGLAVRPKTRLALLPALLCFILAAALAAIYTSTRLIPLVAAAAVFCAGAVVLLLRYARLRRGALEAEALRRQILRKYHAASAEDINTVLAGRLAMFAALDGAEEAERLSRAAYEQARASQSELEEAAIADLDFSGGSSEAARLSRALAAARADSERLSAQIAGINGRLSAMGDPLVLSSSLSCMREQYDQIQAEYDALSLAVDTLREADTQMQSRFSPELGRVAARYMSAVTGGRYEDVLINRDFTARTRTKDDSVAREAEYLSAGTLDLMYLAVRLAVCELALPDGEPCPLIIDDALVNLDETRLGQAMELLKQIAKKRQVILFTCRK
ncbi:MAG: AAA family ATPase [Oscillospiraceae bacterium]|nr:AAA family ATPase [Oscillospiraceae bacterium]